MTFLYPEYNIFTANELLEISQDISRKFAPCYSSHVSVDSFNFTPQELLDISEEISIAHAPKKTDNGTELLILPVDPDHIYAFWNLGKEYHKDDESEKSSNDQLILRIYPQPKEPEAWFDVALDTPKTQQLVPLPELSENTSYIASIGKCNTENVFTAIANSKVNQTLVNKVRHTEDQVHSLSKHASGLGINRKE